MVARVGAVGTVAPHLGQIEQTAHDAESIVCIAGLWSTLCRMLTPTSCWSTWARMQGYCVTAIFVSARMPAKSSSAGTSVSDITAPATGAFAVFLCGDSARHAFGIVTASGIQKSTTTAVNSGTTATSTGGTNQAGLAAAWAGYGLAFSDRKLSDSEMERVAERLIKQARYLGVTVNG